MGKHLPAIDGLRAFAVLSVVAYHAGLPLSAGYVGVDVFFVISGYVITRMLLSEPRIDLAAFYARRVRRILPALVVVVAATLALSAAMLSADLQIATNRSAMAAMAMGANVWFQLHTGYFDGAADQQPLLHLWSLAVEEQFYFVWPLLLIAFRRKPWVLAVLALGSLWLAESVSQPTAFYSMPTRFWELAVGGLLVMLPASRLGRLTAPVGLLCLCASVLTEPASFPGFGAALPVAGSLLVLHAIHSGVRIPPMEWRPVRYVGLVSYSFYLWHWPLLAIAKGYSFDPPTLQTNLALCVLAFALASMSYHFIETPFRRANPPKVRAIALGVTACVALAGCAAAMGSPKVDDSLQAQLQRERPHAFPCHTELLDAPVAPKCADGPVVVWGDSHAWMWIPYAERFGKVQAVTRGHCGPMQADRGPECVQFNAMALERAKQGKVVLVAARWTQADVARMPVVLDALGGVPKVIVMGPAPSLPYLPTKCVAKRQVEKCSAVRSTFDRNAEPLRVALRAAVAKHPNATLVDPANYFCDATKCPMMRDGHFVFWDNNHVTPWGARGFTGR